MSEIFASTFASSSVPSIVFNPKWENGTGYFDRAVEGQHAPVLAEGEMVKSQNDNGRKIIIVGTPAGNFVVFQRYEADENRYTFNCSRAVSSLYGGGLDSGLLKEKSIDLILGDIEYPTIVPNIGNRMARFLDFVKSKPLNKK